MIVLSGGTGTPKLLDGLRHVIPEEDITVVVNTAEDLWVSGNLITPDIDTVLYLFSDRIDRSKWWGVRDDTFCTHEAMKLAGHDEGMMIGDLDRATHIMRSELLRKGMSLTEAIRSMTSSLASILMGVSLIRWRSNRKSALRRILSSIGDCNPSPSMRGRQLSLSTCTRSGEGSTAGLLW